MFHYFIFDLKKDNFSGFSTKKFHNGISIDFLLLHMYLVAYYNEYFGISDVIIFVVADFKLGFLLKQEHFFINTITISFFPQIAFVSLSYFLSVRGYSQTENILSIIDYLPTPC